jgi:hypothetical protein
VFRASVAAEDLIKNAQVQAIVWGPLTFTKANHTSHLGRRHNHIPVISFSSISPTPCAFWVEDPITTSGLDPKFGFTLGGNSITFLNLKTSRRIDIEVELDTRETREACEGPLMKIAVPLKHGFKEFVDAADPNNFTGYSIDIFEAAMRTLHPTPCYDYFLFQDTYDELVGNVSLGVRLLPHTSIPSPYKFSCVTFQFCCN